MEAIDEIAVATALAREAASTAAPEELVLFDEVAAEYRAHGDRLLESSGRDVPVGFGLELALMTPYLLAVATAVVKFLASSVGDEIKPVVGRRVLQWLVKGRSPEAGDSVRPRPKDGDLIRDAALWAQLHSVAEERALLFGLPPEKSNLLAEAIVGALAKSTAER